MQYVRNISDSVSTAWNSLNPATLSGAIDVIVVEQADGSLSCSPFHVRFGKFSLLRPYEKKVDFLVNGHRQNYAMKLGEGGEAFFVFETSDTIPQSLQTSPLASPASSPPLAPSDPAEPLHSADSPLPEPELLRLDTDATKSRSSTIPTLAPAVTITPHEPSRPGLLQPPATSPELVSGRPPSRGWTGPGQRGSISHDVLPTAAHHAADSVDSNPRNSEHGDAEAELSGLDSPGRSARSRSPPPLATSDAVERAMILSKELSAVNIPSHVNEAGDLMLDMTGFKNSEEDAIRAEVVARKILSEELEGDYDIGALIGMDEAGNLWIYSSEEAKEVAMKKTVDSLRPSSGIPMDAVSDPGYQSDDSTASTRTPSHRRTESDAGQMSVQTAPTTPGSSAGNPNKNYAKTLRLTSDQLKDLKLKPGENNMSFTVNRATCSANMYLWRHDVPVVISDIDGTITKSDALGHVLNMIGRDWTHVGIAKLYSDIVANGYNIMYLTSRSVGQADTTRAYLNGIVQEDHRLPRGPTILSPDRTMAALRREIYLRKPHVFKMATLRDIRSLYGPESHCFYAGFGNRLTDQISYRTVDVPRNRIFTINSNAEVSLDLMNFNKRLNYVNIGEVVDHFFPPPNTLVKGGGVEFTDFSYWRDPPLELDEFSASESDADERDSDADYDDDDVGQMGESYLSQGDDPDGSVMSGSYMEGEQQLMDSIIEGGEDADDEEYEEGDEYDDEDEPYAGEDDVYEPRGRLAPQDVSLKTAPTTPKAAVEDINAEIITGMRNLGVEK